MSAFDVNGNSIVEQKEFVELIENAMGGASAFKEPSPSNARGRSGGSLAKNSAPPSVQDAAPKVETLNLVDTVNPKDRINAQQSIDYMK
tara:strand:+ start:853 stop:1119 length:267 start_codon:yes stop_codon:yes gene_type:complete